MGEVFWAALKLGLTSFGGPIAHLGYFERTYVKKLQWLTSARYAQLVALCQSLPGPTSSQVGFLVGLHKAGWTGGLAAWVGFTLPSALLMYAFGLLTAGVAPWADHGLLPPVLHGLVLTAVGVVAQAVWSMARSLCPDWQRCVLAALSCLALLMFASPSTQIAVMLAGAAWGWFLCRRTASPLLGVMPSNATTLTEVGKTLAAEASAQTPLTDSTPAEPTAQMPLADPTPAEAAPRTPLANPTPAKAAAAREIRPRTAFGALSLYLLLLAGVSAFALLAPRGPLALAAIFYRAGALVFGGGHVVLPLLRQELVPGGWLSDSDFLSGYALAQGLPGPLFTVAAYLGAASAPAHHADAWSLLAVVAIFLPGLLLATGGVSLWNALVKIPGASAALAGVNASVVGILAAALYDPVWRSGVNDLTDAAVAVSAFILLQVVRFPAIGTAVLCVLVSLLRYQLFL